MVKKIILKKKKGKELVIYLNEEAIAELKEIINGTKDLEDICFPSKAIYSELIKAHKNGQLNLFS